MWFRVSAAGIEGEFPKGVRLSSRPQKMFLLMICSCSTATQELRFGSLGAARLTTYREILRIRRLVKSMRWLLLGFCLDAATTLHCRWEFRAKS